MRIEFTLDCVDLDRTAGFWASAAGFTVAGTIAGRYVSLSGQGVTLTLQRVGEPKSGKNRMHIDLLVDDLEGEVRRLEGLGASRLTASARREFGQTWFVLVDPEGNEFCVAREPSDEAGPTGPPEGGRKPARGRSRIHPPDRSDV
jgi:predicted enzyme related to lactoylglutathione lyase